MRSPIGEDSIIKTVERKEFIDYYEHYYTPKRTFLVMTGDIEPKAIESKIKRVFSDWKAKAERKDRDRGKISSKRPLEAGFFYHPEIVTQISIQNIKPEKKEKDTLQTRMDTLLRQAGFLIFNRRLGAAVNKEGSLFTQANAYHYNNWDFFSKGGVTVTPADPKKWRESLEFAEQELRRALEYGFQPEEIGEQLAKFETYLQNQADGVETRHNGFLASSLIQAFSEQEVLTDPVDDLRLFRSFRKQINPVSISSAFLQAWKDSERLLYVESSQDSNLSEKIIKKVYANSQLQEVNAPERLKLPEFAYTHFGKKGIVKESSQIEDLDLTQITFDNQVRLNLKKTNFENRKIYVEVRFGEGKLSMPKGKAGLPFLADSAFIQGGLQAHSINELETIMAGKNLDANFSVYDNRFSFSAITTPKDIRDQMALIAAYLTAPGWRREGIERFRKRVVQDFAANDIFPNWYIQTEAARLIHSDDERFFLPDQEILLALTLEDLKDWLNPVFANSPIEITLVGDLDIEQSIEAVAGTLGALPRRKSKFLELSEARKIKFPQGGATPHIIHHKGNPEDEAALSLIYWPVTSWKGNVPLARKIALLAKIFGRQLLEVVREKEGGDYSPSVGSSLDETFPDYGFIVAYMSPKPNKIDHFNEVAFMIAKQLREGNITQDAYDRALKPILETIEDNFENNYYWVSRLSDSQSWPESLDHNFRRIRQDYETITLNDVKQLAKKLLRDEMAYRISILPLEKKK